MTLHIDVPNVNQAFNVGLRLIRETGRLEESRAGPVLAHPGPVMTTYHHPDQRVLTNMSRRANPFFHLHEALWMLSGHSDAASLNVYVRDFGERFAEEDGHLWGAYGERWKWWFDVDQLAVAVSRLRANPDDRRVVVAMWDAREDLGASKRDIPCNTHIYLRVLQGHLELTVVCRSNDIIWGAYGANAVHFSILQEYLAGRIGVGMGRMHQFSHNWHAYTSVLDRMQEDQLDPYLTRRITPVLLGDKWDRWDEDLSCYIEWHDAFRVRGEEPQPPGYHNKFFDEVALPMVMCHHWYQQGSLAEAREWLLHMPSGCDWRYAAEQWLMDREEVRRETR